MKIRTLIGGLVVALLSVPLAACGGTSPSSGSSGVQNAAATGAASSGGSVVTVYSADGLGTWYTPMFKQFTAQTGIKVNYVEAGSSEVVGRVEKEHGNPQADLLVTLPPFIQQAQSDGMLDSLGVDTSAVPAADRDTKGQWTALVNNYNCFIVKNGTSPKPSTWNDLLSSTYKGKLQYSTPGQAGDGTAVLLLLEHEMGTDGALAYLKKLQTNNVGPSSSTGALQPKVSSGSLAVANGDVQMNLSSISSDKSAFSVFFPRNGSAAPVALALPYDAGVVAGAPHKTNGQKLLSFLLSKSSQQQVSSLAYGIPVRSDVSTSDANAAKVRATMKGVEIYHPDWNAVSASLDKTVDAYTSAVGS